jgi:NNP family nitrate/nitrite transporter-like MFS transporter
MDNVRNQNANLRAMGEILKHRESWVMSLLYIGTFGSFIGFGFAFGQVLQVQFHAQFDTPVKAAYLTFLGPLLGSLSRPVGGRMADRWTGARVTFWTFAAMAASAALVLTASRQHSLPLFLTGFVLLFVLSGVGNGSTYKMIPAIYRDRPAREAQRRTSALIGIAGAVGAFGGVLVSVAFRQSFLNSHDGDSAYLAFLGYYALCLLLTWAVYLRRARA